MTLPFHQIPIEDWPAYEQLALERLHVKMVGLTSRWLLYVGKQARDALDEAANDEGKLDLAGFFAVRKRSAAVWQETFPKWTGMLANARWEAALLALSHVARYHVHYFGGEPGVAEERRGWRQATELEGFAEAGPPFGQSPGAVWTSGLPYQPALERVVDAAVHRLWHDGMKLSERIWRLDHKSLEGIRKTLYNGMMAEKSVVEIAGDLEKYLGADARCPRWTDARLNLTPSQIAAGDDTGLIRSGTPGCETRGVSYNALRLARNEVQIAHSRAVDTLFARMPYVTGERVYLNDLHPGPLGCECEELVGYPGSRVSEVLPVGSVSLPIHVHCLCHKMPVLADVGVVRPEVDGGDPAWIDYRREMQWHPQMDGEEKKQWWLLLLIVAEAYRRWSEARREETDAALVTDPDDPMWTEWQ